MIHIRYSKMAIKEIKPNVGYSEGELCEQSARNGCEQVKKCLEHLSIGSSNIAGDEYRKAAQKWRREEFKKCKQVIIEIRR